MHVTDKRVILHTLNVRTVVLLHASKLNILHSINNKKTRGFFILWFSPVPVWAELIHWICDSENSFHSCNLLLCPCLLSLAYCFCCLLQFIRVQRNLGMFFSGLLINKITKQPKSSFFFLATYSSFRWTDTRSKYWFICLAISYSLNTSILFF